MGEIRGFLKYSKALPKTEKATERIKHFKEFNKETSDSHAEKQSARCMDCGIPFCHSGCPLGNVIPDFNDAVYKQNWKQAFDILKSTNNFPEFTGRICPAPCESSCVLGINKDEVAIEYIEKTIIEKAYAEGWVTANDNINRNGKTVAIVGSGPSGLACADQLNENGYQVTVYEKADRIGGLLRYGIPDFKLEKNIIDRRLDIMKQSGISFVTNTNVGVDITADELKSMYDAVILCGGATVARDLTLEGRHLQGVHFAMEYLEQNNKLVSGDTISDKELIDVKNKKVMVLGGGDTGSDCIGTSNRRGASAVTQIELLSKPPASRKEENPWPTWPQTLRTSSSHEEGCEREWSVLTKRFVSEDGVHLSGVEIVRLNWEKDIEGKYTMKEMEGTREVIPCDKAFLAIGFLHGQKEGLLSQLNVQFDNRGNIKTDNYHTSVNGVFAAGDIRRGQSLVVWAINEGRECAIAVDRYLQGVEKTSASSFALNEYAV